MPTTHVPACHGRQPWTLAPHTAANRVHHLLDVHGHPARLHAHDSPVDGWACHAARDKTGLGQEVGRMGLPEKPHELRTKPVSSFACERMPLNAPDTHGASLYNTPSCLRSGIPCLPDGVLEGVTKTVRGNEANTMHEGPSQMAHA